MKTLSLCLFLVLGSFAYAAVSLDDIVKLSKTRTSDDVVMKLIQKEGLAKPVTSKDIVYLKQHGVSDRVIQYLMKLSSQDEPAVHADQNLRSYYTTTKTGKRIQVVTNLDENGKRMGGPVPPPAPEHAPQQAAMYERPPQEIRIVVESDSRRDDEYREEYPEYIDDRYVMPEYPAYYPYSSSFYSPYYPYYPKNHHRRGHHFPKDPNQANWRYDYSKNRPLIHSRNHSGRNHSGRNRTPNSRPSSSGVRSFKR